MAFGAITDIVKSWIGKSWCPQDTSAYWLVWLRVIFRKNWLVNRSRWIWYIGIQLLIPWLFNVVIFLGVFGMGFEMAVGGFPFRDMHLIAEDEFPPVMGPLYQHPEKDRILLFFNTSHLKDPCGRRIHALVKANTWLFKTVEFNTTDPNMYKDRDVSIENVITIRDININKVEKKFYYHMVNSKFMLRDKSMFPPYGPFMLPLRTVGDAANMDDLLYAQKLMDLEFLDCYRDEMSGNGVSGWYPGMPKNLLTEVMMHYKSQPVFNYSVHSIQTLLVLANSWFQLLLVHEIGYQFTVESRSGFKAHLRTMGIGRFKYYVGNIFFYAIKSFAIVTLTMFPFMAYVKSASILMWFVGAIVYSFMIAVFGAFCTTFISVSSRYFDIAIILVWFSLHTDNSEWNDVSFHYPESILTLLNFADAFFMYNNYLAQLTMLGRTEVFPSMWWGCSQQMCGGLALVGLFVDVLLFFVFTLYLDAITCSEAEGRLTPLFFLSGSFWRPRVGPPEHEAAEAKQLYEDVEHDVEEKMMKTGLESNVPPALQTGTSGSDKLGTLQTKTNQSEDKEKNKAPGAEQQTQIGENDVTLDGVGLFHNGDWRMARVQLKAYAGQVLVTYGHNLSGHRLMLDLIAGKLRPTYGEVRLLGETVLKPKPRMTALSSDRDTFIEDLTLRQHIEMFTNLRCGRDEESDLELAAVRASLNLEDLMDTKLQRFSHSERRRAAFLLTFCGKCPVVLFDNVSSDCSLNMRRTMEMEIHKMKTKRTIIVASDNPIEAEMLGERLAFFSRGRLIGIGTPEFYLKVFGNAFLLSIWPSPKFDEKCAMDLSTLIVEKLESADIDNYYNKNFRVRFPPRKQSEYNEVLKELRINNEKYGISYCEMQKTGIEELYTSALEQDTSAMKEHKNPENVKQLCQLQESVETGFKCWMRQLLAIWKLRLRFMIRKSSLSFSLFILPALIAIPVYFSLHAFDTLSDYYCSDFPRYKPFRIMTDTEMKPFIEHSLKNSPYDVEVVIKNISELHQRKTDWFFEYPPHIFGIWKASSTFKRKAWLFTYSMSSLQHNRFEIQSFVANALIGKFNAIRVCLDDPESHMYRVRINQSDTTVRSGAPVSEHSIRSKFRILQGMRRRMDVMFLIACTKFQTVAAVALYISSTAMTIFPAHQRNANALRMQHMYGLNRLVYWLSNATYDLILSIIQLAILLLVYAAVGFWEPFHVGLVIVAWFLHFIVILPMSYAAAKLLRGYMSYTIIAVYTGVPSFTILVLFIVNNIYSINYLTLSYFTGFLCVLSPTASATFIIGAAHELYGHDFKDVSPYYILDFPLRALAAHGYFWLIFLVMTSEWARRMWGRVVHVWSGDNLIMEEFDPVAHSTESMGGEVFPKPQSEPDDKYDELSVARELDEHTLRAAKKPSIESKMGNPARGAAGHSAMAEVKTQPSTSKSSSRSAKKRRKDRKSAGANAAADRSSEVSSERSESDSWTDSENADRSDTDYEEPIERVARHAAGSDGGSEQGGSGKLSDFDQRGTNTTPQTQTAPATDGNLLEHTQSSMPLTPKLSPHRKHNSFPQLPRGRPSPIDSVQRFGAGKGGAQDANAEAKKADKPDKAAEPPKVAAEQPKANVKAVVIGSPAAAPSPAAAKPTSPDSTPVNAMLAAGARKAKSTSGKVKSKGPEKTQIVASAEHTKLQSKEKVAPAAAGDKPGSKDANDHDIRKDSKMAPKSNNTAQTQPGSKTKTGSKLSSETNAEFLGKPKANILKMLLKKQNEKGMMRLSDTGNQKDLVFKQKFNENRKNAAELCQKIFAKRVAPSDSIAAQAPTQPGSVLELVNVSATENGKLILNDISFKLEDATLAIYGWEGCGSTQLLEAIAGIRTIGAGDILLDGTPVTSTSHAGIGFVPMHDNGLLEYLTGREMLEHTCALGGHTKETARDIIDLLSILMGMQDLMPRRISGYRGPDKTLLLTAMACTTRLSVFLIDDPSSVACPTTQHILWSFMMMLRTMKTLVLLSSSSPVETEVVADKLMFLVDGRNAAYHPVVQMKRSNVRCLQLVMTMQPRCGVGVVPTIIKQTLADLRPQEQVHGNPKQIRMALYMTNDREIHDVFKQVHNLVSNLPVIEYSMTMSSLDEVYNYNFL